MRRAFARYKGRGDFQSARLSVLSSTYTFQHQLEERTMPVIPRSDYSGGGYEYFYAPQTVVSRIDGLPAHHDKVTTYGGGGGSPIKIKSGPFKGWSFGGGNRSRVYENTSVFTSRCVSTTYFLPSFHPRIPAFEKLIWGFWSITASSDAYPSDAERPPVSVGPLPTPRPMILI